MTIRIKPSHQGLLRKETGTPKGKNIPMGVLERARRSADPARRKQAVFAINARSWSHK